MPMLTMLRIALPVCPFHSPERILVGEPGHPVEDLVDLGHHVDPVDGQRGALRHAQRDVQHRAVLRYVDPLPGEHRVPVLLEPGLLGQLEQQAQGLVGDPVLRIIEVEPGGLGAEPLAAIRVLGEEIAQMAAHQLRMVLGQGIEGRALPQRRNRHEVSPLAGC